MSLALRWLQQSNRLFSWFWFSSVFSSKNNSFVAITPKGNKKVEKVVFYVPGFGETGMLTMQPSLYFSHRLLSRLKRPEHVAIVIPLMWDAEQNEPDTSCFPTDDEELDRWAAYVAQDIVITDRFEHSARYHNIMEAITFALSFRAPIVGMGMSMGGLYAMLLYAKFWREKGVSVFRGIITLATPFHFLGREDLGRSKWPVEVHQLQNKNDFFSHTICGKTRAGPIRNYEIDSSGWYSHSATEFLPGSAELAAQIVEGFFWPQRSNATE